MPSEDFEHMKNMSETAFFIEKYNQPYLKSGHILHFISYLKSFDIDITTIQDITIDY